MLTDIQQVELRRILGYPAIGTPVGSDITLASLSSYFRFFDPTGQLERRMLTLQTSEEVQIFGSEHENFSDYAQPFGEYYTPTDGSPTVYGWVPIIRLLQSDVTGSRSFAAFNNADIVAFSPLEIARRRSLLREKRQGLADFLYIPLDPDIQGNRRSTYRRR